MVVQHNLRAMNSNRMLGLTTSVQAKSTEKLSSGYKINRAADDAAGLSISEKMRKQIRGLTQASLNAQDGISAVQTAEGALNEVQDMLQRMNELAVKAANGTMSDDDRNYIQDEIAQLETEIDRVATTTKFNESYLLKGDDAAPKTTVYSYKMVDTAASFKAADSDAKFYAAGESVELADSAIIAKLEAGEKIYTDSASVQPDSKKEDNLVWKDSKGASVTIDIASWGTNQATDSITIAGVMADSTANDGDAIVTALMGNASFSAAYTATFDSDNDKIVVTANDPSATDSAALKTAITMVNTNNSDATTTVQGAVADSVAEGVYDSASPTVVLDESAYDGKYFTKGGSTALTAAELVANLKNPAPAVIYTEAAPEQTEAADSDYTYTESSSGMAVLYDSDGKALKASDLTDLAADSTVVLYTDSEATDSVADMSAYTESTQVNGALALKLHVGADSTDDNKIGLQIKSMSAAAIGVKGLNVTSEKDATAVIDVISSALQAVSTQRSALGAIQNRLEHTIANLDNVVENTTAAESQIRDTDMATEMVKYSNNNILAQAGQAMLAQANQANQGVLSLLG